MKLTIKEIVLLPMFAALIFASKMAMAAIPNVHLVGMMIMTLTLVYRQKALYVIYLYVFAEGLFFGFTPWWIPYLYVWTVLWGVTMLLPKKMPPWLAAPVYMAVCSLHGLCFGTLFAPMQALLFGYDFKTMLLWISAGIPYDITHAIGNLCFGALILPLSALIRRVDRATPSGRRRTNAL